MAGNHLLMSQGRNIIQLRPPSGTTKPLCDALKSTGFKKARPRSEMSPIVMQGQFRLSPLTRALKDFQNTDNPAVKQRALKYLSYSTTIVKNHPEILGSGALYHFVDCLDSVDLVNRSLACMALSNLARNGMYA